MSIQPKILKESLIQLEPLNETHKDDLYHAAQYESIWTYNTSKAFGDRFYRWFDKAMNSFIHWFCTDAFILIFSDRFLYLVLLVLRINLQDKYQDVLKKLKNYGSILMSRNLNSLKIPHSL
jgi:hypothetical protein